MAKERKKVALVLSGGAVLGLAHIGVIRCLEKHNIPIDIVVGTSMGGVVGASYCAGLTTDAMTKFACKFRTIHFFDLNSNKAGLFSGKGVMKNINKFLPDVKIEELDKVFACVACDLLTEKQEIIGVGSIRDAVRTTLSLPGIFVPYYRDDKVLVDGGIINNLPEDVAMQLGAEVIISCDVLTNYRLFGKPKNLLDSLIYSINTMTKELQKYKSCHADVLIQPNLTGQTSQIFFTKKNAENAIRIGEEETEKHIKQIKKLISN